MIENL